MVLIEQPHKDSQVDLIQEIQKKELSKHFIAF